MKLNLWNIHLAFTMKAGNYTSFKKVLCFSIYTDYMKAQTNNWYQKNGENTANILNAALKD